MAIPGKAGQGKAGVVIGTVWYRQQLADAFNIDAAHHTPVLERNRLATHPPELLLYAWHHRSWIANVSVPSSMIIFVCAYSAGGSGRKRV